MLLSSAASFTANQAPVGVPRLNSQNPLSRGLQYLWLPALGLKGRDTVSGVGLSVVGTVTSKINKHPAWYTNNSTNGLDSEIIPNPLAPVTMAVVFIPDTITVLSAENLFSFQRAGSLGTRNVVGIRSYFGTIDAFSANSSGTVVKSSSANPPVTSAINTAVAVFRSATFRQMYLNGVAGNSNTTSNIPLARDTVSISSGAGTTRSTGHAAHYYMCVVWQRELAPAEALSFSRNPWQIFLTAPQVGLLFGKAAAGGNTYTFAPSGAVTFSGQEYLLRGRIFVPAGTVSFSGSSTQAHTRAIQPSGSCAFSGGANLLRTRATVPAGQVVFSGSAAVAFSRLFVFSAGGNVVFSATAALTRTKLLSAGGTVALTGTATQLHSRSYVPSGAVLFSGTAPFEVGSTYVFAAGGTVVFSGQAGLIRAHKINTDGQITFTAAAALLRSRAVVPSGQFTLSGSAVVLKTQALAPSGNVTFSGNSGMTFIPAGSVTNTQPSRISVGVSRSIGVS